MPPINPFKLWRVTKRSLCTRKNNFKQFLCHWSQKMANCPFCIRYRSTFSFIFKKNSIVYLHELIIRRTNVPFGNSVYCSVALNNSIKIIGWHDKPLWPCYLGNLLVTKRTEMIQAFCNLHFIRRKYNLMTKINTLLQYHVWLFPVLLEVWCLFTFFH